MKLTESQRQYLKNVLRLNPVYQSEEIHLARVEQLETDSYDQRSKRQLASREYADRRATVRKKIGEIRETIWSSPIDELEAEVGNLDITEFPEYEQDALIPFESFCNRGTNFPAWLLTKITMLISWNV